VLLTKVQRFSPLKAWGMRLVKRIGGRKARIAVARKLGHHPALHRDRWHRIGVDARGGHHGLTRDPPHQFRPGGAGVLPGRRVRTTAQRLWVDLGKHRIRPIHTSRRHTADTHLGADHRPPRDDDPGNDQNARSSLTQEPLLENSLGRQLPKRSSSKTAPFSADAFNRGLTASGQDSPFRSAPIQAFTGFRLGVQKQPFSIASGPSKCRVGVPCPGGIVIPTKRSVYAYEGLPARLAGSTWAR
jgi:hypothetical protein